jgi:phosphotriesterase-related protein
VSPPANSEEECQKPLTDIENLGWLRYFPYSHSKNLLVDDFSVMVKELNYFKAAGGQTIVDVTVTGLRLANGSEYLDKVHQLSQATSVNIICGTGFYVDHVHPDYVKQASIEDLAQFMVKELNVGIGESNYQAGVIGEIGCSWPLTENEKKILQAAALAQKLTGAPLIIHPGRDERAPIEIVQILQEAGADISHTVMSHLDRTMFVDQNWSELASTGIYLELDLFGIETSYYQQKESIYMMHDGQRIDRVVKLVKDGFVKQILLAHDIHTNHRLRSFGGHGYSHLFERIEPRLISFGLTTEDIHTITVDNPKRWLEFHSPS